MMLGIDRSLLPESVSRSMAYDEARTGLRPRARRERESTGRSGPSTGAATAATACRATASRYAVAHGSARGLPPVMRARLWPDLPDREESLALFLEWSSELAASGLLDVLSIGASAARRGRRPLPAHLSGGIFRDLAGRAADARGAGGGSGRRRERRPRLGRADRLRVARTLALVVLRPRRQGKALGAREPSVRGSPPSSSSPPRRSPSSPTSRGNVAAMGGDDLSYVLSGLVAAKAAKASGIRRLDIPRGAREHRRRS